MAKLQPFRDEAVRKPEDLRVRLNELVAVVNERQRHWKAVRVPDVQPSSFITLQNPGFPVGAIVLGGVTPTNGGTAPASPVLSWSQQGDGRIILRLEGLTGPGKLFAVNLVLFEGEAS